MKKILPLLLLLLLLIIYCVWSKKDNIHVSSHHQTHEISTPVIAQETRYIDYVIKQNNTQYTLHGDFTNTQQQALFSKTFKDAKQNLVIENTTTNKALVGDLVIAFTNTLLPHFISNYKEGKIVYHEEKLVLSGIANSYEAQHEMQRLLNTSSIASQDNSSVVMEKPIVYSIKKRNNAVEVTGTFGNSQQIAMIQKHLPPDTKALMRVKPHHVDQGSLKVVDTLLPFFLKEYTSGSIVYDYKTLNVSGLVRSKSDLVKLKKLLSDTNISTINHTKVDPKILAKAQQAAKKARAERKAKQALLEKARKAQIEAENKAAREAKIKADKAEQQRQADAMKKAQQNKEKEAIEAKAEAKEKAILLAKAKRVELKTKIANLLKLGTIEFNVNKSTLTEKGLITVEKLAKILNAYTSIHIEIAGHTDSDGSAEYNQKLSQSRVDMVKSKLIATSIKKSRLTAKGYGESKPLVPNDTEKNKAKNRRVEITILGE